MKTNELIICCVFIIIGVVFFCSVITLNHAEDTQINVLSSSSLYNGDNVSVQLTTENGTPIANQQVDVTIIDANGGRNTLNLMTDSDGQATFEVDGVTVGNYTLECVFGGNDEYKQSNTTSALEIKEEVIVQSSSYDFFDAYADKIMETEDLDGDGIVDRGQYEGSTRNEIAYVERHRAD